MRYYRLLPPNGIYTQQQIRVLSSAAERCIMSANSLLAGFMPPLEHSNLLPIQWQPVAVNTIPRHEDTVNFFLTTFIKIYSKCSLIVYSCWPKRNPVQNMTQF